MASEERVLKPEDRIYDLVDLVREDVPWKGKGDQEVTAIDGRGCKHVLREGDVIYNLDDLLGSGANDREWPMNDDIKKIVAEMAERIAREIMPDIAERVIREEIEKLKRAD